MPKSVNFRGRGADKELHLPHITGKIRQDTEVPPI